MIYIYTRTPPPIYVQTRTQLFETGSPYVTGDFPFRKPTQRGEMGADSGDGGDKGSNMGNNMGDRGVNGGVQAVLAVHSTGGAHTHTAYGSSTRSSPTGGYVNDIDALVAAGE